DDTGTAEPLVLSHLEQLLDAPRYGGANFLFMNAETRRRLWSVLQPQIRFLGTTEIDGGFKVRSYNDMPIIEVKPNSTAVGADLDGTILAVNTDMVFMPILQDLTYEELAHTRDSVDFILKMYCGLVVEGGEHYHAKLRGFDTAVA